MESFHVVGECSTFIYVQRCLVHLQSISSTSYVRDFRMNVILAAFPSYMYVEKAAEMMFVQKTRAYNVDEIDTGMPNNTAVLTVSVDSFASCNS